MSALSCNSVRDRAPEFALGIVTGEERADVLAHLGRCTSCQSLVGEFASVADALMSLVPEAEPSAELTPPVLRAMRPARSRALRYRLVAAAAALILVVAAAGGVTLAIGERGGGEPGATTSTGLRSAPMLASNNLTVGRLVATNHRSPALAVNFDYWVPDGHYHLEVQPAIGSRTRIGAVDITRGRGAWTGRIPRVDKPLSVALVDASGNVVCEGRLP